MIINRFITYIFVIRYEADVDIEATDSLSYRVDLLSVVSIKVRDFDS